MATDPTRKHDRLDQELVTRGLAPTRAKAQALILAGRVFSGDLRLDKAGARVLPDQPLRVAPGKRWVSRGGHKLEGALERFAVEIEGRTALDVGASTGGFTEVLLARGARSVIALDVGRGQLDWSLRSDPRVRVLEGRNARYLERGELPSPPDLAVIDVSFISLVRVLPPVASCLPGDADIVALVKPQFEVGRGNVGRGGVVRDPALHRDVLERTTEFAVERGWTVRDIVVSPLRGAEGNVEFFVHIRTGSSPEAADSRLAALIEREVRAGQEDRS